jgi:signal transduction histidine kinase
VGFRYKLEGSDPDWQDAGNRREAFYTNLTPGRYTFRVVAANSDGVWNTSEASVSFTIRPAFYQTTWFYALRALLCLAALYALYTVRTRQLAAQVRGRLEVRLAERERIARELHDTLLQGVQGLILRFHAVAGRISQRDPARALMEQALGRADQILVEGRDRVKDLRSTAGDDVDLPVALTAEGEQLVLAHPAQFRTTVQGAHRDLHPIAREEIFLIAREALGNAFRHAGARHIEAEVSYGEAVLHVRIRDDGGGISAEVLDAGERPGHFGLLGMRERAEKIRAQLKIWSKPGAGTEIDLQVPAEVAYRRSQTVSRRTWWTKRARLRR